MLIEQEPLNLLANRSQWGTVLNRLCQSDKTPEVKLILAVIEQAIADLYLVDIVDRQGTRRINNERLSAVTFFNRDGFDGMCSALGIDCAFLQNAIVKHGPRISWRLCDGKFELVADLLLPEDLEPISKSGMARRIAPFKSKDVVTELERG